MSESGIEEAAAQRRRLLFAACLASGAGLLAGDVTYGVAGGLLTFGGVLLGLELWAEYWTYRLVIERERRTDSGRAGGA